MISSDTIMIISIEDTAGTKIEEINCLVIDLPYRVVFQTPLEFKDTAFKLDWGGTHTIKASWKGWQE